MSSTAWNFSELYEGRTQHKWTLTFSANEYMHGCIIITTTTLINVCWTTQGNSKTIIIIWTIYNELGKQYIQFPVWIKLDLWSLVLQFGIIVCLDKLCKNIIKYNIGWQIIIVRSLGEKCHGYVHVQWWWSCAYGVSVSTRYISRLGKPNIQLDRWLVL